MSAGPVPPVTPTLPGGTVLASKYRLDRLIGEGGMGAVYVAENLDVGRKVAIKVLHTSMARDPHLVTRFRQEARAAAAIGHPGIIDVFDLGHAEDGSVFIVMELLSGETLGQKLDRVGRMAIPEVEEVIGAALEALTAAHEKGIVHRDLKPDNIFLVQQPVPGVKLLDFGISKLQGAEEVRLTATGTVMGTPLYMAPEQARQARDAGPAADLYAMGAVLYHTLAGRPPFVGTTYAEVLSRLLIDPPPPLAELRLDAPMKICALTHALLAKTPEERPADAATALSLFRAAFEGSTVGPRRNPQQPTTPVDVVGLTMAAPTPLPRGPVRVASEPTTRPRRVPVVAWVAGGAVVLGALAFLRLGKQTSPPVAPPPSQPVVAAPADAAPPPVTPAPDAAPPDAAPTRTAERRVTLVFVVDPPQTELVVDGTPVPCAAGRCTLSRPRGTEARAEAEASGHQSWHQRVTFERDRTIQVRLVPRPTPPPPPPPTVPVKPPLKDDEVDRTFPGGSP